MGGAGANVILSAAKDLLRGDSCSHGRSFVVANCKLSLLDSYTTMRLPHEGCRPMPGGAVVSADESDIGHRAGEIGERGSG